MTFDFWAVANSTEFQTQAANESKSHSGGSFKNFTEAGEYNLTIQHAELKQTRAGDPMLNLRVVADSGESGFWSLLVGHGGGKSTAATIAQKNLALILKYAGAKASGPDAMIGLRVKTWIKMREGTDGVSRPEFRPIGPVESVAKPAAPKPAAKPAPVQAQVRQVEVDEVSDDDIPF